MVVNVDTWKFNNTKWLDAVSVDSYWIIKLSTNIQKDDANLAFSQIEKLLIHVICLIDTCEYKVSTVNFNTQLSVYPFYSTQWMLHILMHKCI